MHRILIVSDCTALSEDLGAALEGEGFDVVIAADALEAMKRVYDTHPSVLIVEDRLSSAESIDLCSHVGSLCCIATILLGQEGTRAQVVDGLNRGADFFMARPISAAEVVARVRSLLRRRQGWPESVRRYLDADRHCALAGNRWVSLTATEFRLLSYLVLNRGRVIPAEELLLQVWPGDGVSPSSLSFYIYKLRQKLDPGVPNAILTHYGVGYRISLEPDSGNGADSPEGTYVMGNSN